MLWPTQDVECFRLRLLSSNNARHCLKVFELSDSPQKINVLENHICKTIVIFLVFLLIRHHRMKPMIMTWRFDKAMVQASQAQGQDHLSFILDQSFN